jgi:uncharacterized protein YqgV (UPF0045/DUF77 family)
MKLVAEISLYPLSVDFTTHIDHYLEKMNTYPELKVTTNQTATHVEGEFEDVVRIVSKEMKDVFLKDHKSVFVIKYINPRD